MNLNSKITCPHCVVTKMRVTDGAYKHDFYCQPLNSSWWTHTCKFLKQTTTACFWSLYYHAPLPFWKTKIFIIMLIQSVLLNSRLEDISLASDTFENQIFIMYSMLHCYFEKQNLYYHVDSDIFIEFWRNHKMHK